MTTADGGDDIGKEWDSTRADSEWTKISRRPILSSHADPAPLARTLDTPSLSGFEGEKKSKRSKLADV